MGVYIINIERTCSHLMRLLKTTLPFQTRTAFEFQSVDATPQNIFFLGLIKEEATFSSREAMA